MTKTTKSNELPKIIENLWNYKRPDKKLEKWSYINDQYKDSNDWGSAVWLLEAKDTEKLYAVLSPEGLAREASEEEIYFLTTGKIPQKYRDQYEEDTV